MCEWLEAAVVLCVYVYVYVCTCWLLAGGCCGAVCVCVRVYMLAVSWRLLWCCVCMCTYGMYMLAVSWRLLWCGRLHWEYARREMCPQRSNFESRAQDMIMRFIKSDLWLSLKITWWVCTHICTHTVYRYTIYGTYIPVLVWNCGYIYVH